MSSRAEKLPGNSCPIPAPWKSLQAWQPPMLSWECWGDGMKLGENESFEVSFVKMEIFALGGAAVHSSSAGKTESRQIFFQEWDLSCSPQEGGKFRHFRHFGGSHVCETEGSPWYRCWAKPGTFAALSQSTQSDISASPQCGFSTSLSPAAPPLSLRHRGSSLGQQHWDRGHT